MIRTSTHRGVRQVLGPLLVVLLSAPVAVGATVQPPLIGVNFTGDVYSIDAATGAATLLGDSGFNRTNGLASDTAGVVFSVAEAGPQSNLITIDPTTGAGTIASPSFETPNGVRGLAISPSDEFFVVVDLDEGGSIGPDTLFTIDPAAGALTEVGATGLTGVQGLAFGPSGDLFAWDIDSGLHTIDPATGVATDVGPAGGVLGVQSIEFRPDGTLLGANDALFEIDAATGVATAIGPVTALDIRGLAFVVPEPAAVTVSALGLLVLAIRNRRSA